MGITLFSPPSWVVTRSPCITNKPASTLCRRHQTKKFEEQKRPSFRTWKRNSDARTAFSRTATRWGIKELSAVQAGGQRLLLLPQTELKAEGNAGAALPKDLYSEPQQIPREQKLFMTRIFFHCETKRNVFRAVAQILTPLWESCWTSHPQKIRNPRRMPQFSRHEYNLVFDTGVNKYLKIIRTWGKIVIFENSF